MRKTPILDAVIERLGEDASLIAAVKEWHAAAEAQASQNAKALDRLHKHRRLKRFRNVSPPEVKRFTLNPNEINGQETLQPHLLIVSKEVQTSPTPVPSPVDLEKDLFLRGKQVAGQKAGGLIARLLKARGSVELARASVEQAALKQDPREYLGRVIHAAEHDKNAKPDWRESIL